MTVFNSIMFISAWRPSSQSEEPVLPLVAFNATISQAAIVPIFNTQYVFVKRSYLASKKLLFIIIILFNASIPISSHCPNFQHNVVTSIFVTSKKMLSFIIIFNIPFPIKYLKQPLSQFSTQYGNINFCCIKKDA